MSDARAILAELDDTLDARLAPGWETRLTDDLGALIASLEETA